MASAEPGRLKLLSRRVRFAARFARKVQRQYGARELPQAMRQLVPDGEVVAWRPPGLAHPLHLRAGSSDPIVFEQIFLDDEYGLELPPDPKLIIDAGANIGLAAVYFANRFPGASILSVEPEPSNYALLRRNIAPYEGRVRAVQGGLWRKSAELEVRDVGQREFGFVVEEVSRKTASSMRGYTVAELIDESGFDRVDILKIDIEGAELEVFSESASRWLGRVGVLVLELHDRLRPGCRAAVDGALAGRDFSTQIRGENEYYFFR